MSLRDEARANTVRTGPKALLDRLVTVLPPDEGADVLELLNDWTIGHAAVARTLSRHYEETHGAVSQNMVCKWRIVNGVKLV